VPRLNLAGRTLGKRGKAVIEPVKTTKREHSNHKKRKRKGLEIFQILVRDRTGPGPLEIQRVRSLEAQGFWREKVYKESPRAKVKGGGEPTHPKRS